MKTVEEMVRDLGAVVLTVHDDGSVAAQVGSKANWGKTVDGVLRGLHEFVSPTPDYRSMSTDELLGELPEGWSVHHLAGGRYIVLNPAHGWLEATSRLAQVDGKTALIAYLEARRDQ